MYIFVKSNYICHWNVSSSISVFFIFLRNSLQLRPKFTFHSIKSCTVDSSINPLTQATHCSLMKTLSTGADVPGMLKNVLHYQSKVVHCDFMLREMAEELQPFPFVYIVKFCARRIYSLADVFHGIYIYTKASTGFRG